MPDIRLIIADLDNTLYDWVTFFAKSFSAMSIELSRMLDVPIEQIYSEFKSLHKFYGNSERPFVILELPCVTRRFVGASREDLRAILAGPLKAFNSARKRELRLYPSVAQTLDDLHRAGILIVAHTEAVLVNSYYRLQRLEIVPFFRRLYTLEDKVAAPLLLPGFIFPYADFVQRVPQAERKPNPRLLLDICARENISPVNAAYIGDSLTRDISMARESGVCSVWARYGTNYDKSLWDILVKITHWSKEDTDEEECLKNKYREVQPDHIIDNFSDLLDIVGLAQGERRVPVIRSVI